LKKVHRISGKGMQVARYVKSVKRRLSAQVEVKILGREEITFAPSKNMNATSKGIKSARG